MRLLESRIIAALLISATTVAVAKAQSPAQTQPGASAAASIVVIGGVEAYWSADQYAKTSGYVSDVKHDMGDRVKKGEVLAVLHVPELEKNLVQAQADVTARQQMKKAADAAVAQARQALAVAKSQLEGYQADQYLAQATLRRQEELSAGKAATPQQLDEVRARDKAASANVSMGQAKVSLAEANIQAALANRDVAAAQVDIAEAQVQEDQALLEYTRIVAPFDGMITRRQVNPGDLVQAATTNKTTPLFTVQQLDMVRVFCDVPEAQADQVSVGAQAEVKLYGLGGQIIKAKVTRLANAIEPTSRTMRTEIDLPNSTGALRPGMYAQVTIRLQPAAPVAEAVPASH